MEKIYHIDKVRKKEKMMSYASVITYGTWLTTLLAFGGLYTVPPLLIHLITLISQDYYKSLIPKTEEWKRFKIAYKEIIDEFVKLTKEMNLKEALEIYSLYDLAYSNGVFSVNSKHIELPTRHDVELMPQLALNSHGVCRHITMMLDDIYKELGFTSSPVVVATPKLKEVAKEVEVPQEIQEAMEEFQKMIQLEVNGKKIEPSDIKIGEAKMIQVSLEEIKPKNIVIRTGNHAFNHVNENGLSYYLDATRRAIYVTSPVNGEFLDNTGTTVYYSNKGTNRFLNKVQKEAIDHLPTLTLGDQIEKINNTQDLIAENEDILVNFQETIQEPLKEAEAMYKLILK